MWHGYCYSFHSRQRLRGWPLQSVNLSAQLLLLGDSSLGLGILHMVQHSVFVGDQQVPRYVLRPRKDAAGSFVDWSELDSIRALYRFPDHDSGIRSNRGGCLVYNFCLGLHA